MNNRILVAVAGLAISCSVLAAGSQLDRKPNYRFVQLAHLSCKEVWIEANQSVEKAFGMIESMTVHLLKQRQYAFPNDKEAGQRFGKSIDKLCRSDPDQLMLNSVDVALREIQKDYP